MTDPTFNTITLTILGIVFVCVLVFVASCFMTLVRWRYPARRIHIRNAGSSFAIGALLITVELGVYHFLYWPAVVQRSEESTLLKDGDIAPHFEFTTLDGDLVVLGPAQKNIVILDFFATWCGPCCAELPDLQRFWDKLVNKSDIKLVVVGREQSEEVLQDFREKNGYTVDFASDPSRELFDMYATRFIPRTVVVGPRGVILSEWTGFHPDQLPQLIAVLKENSGAMSE